jgi:hypothetical protein
MPRGARHLSVVSKVHTGAAGQLLDAFSDVLLVAVYHHVVTVGQRQFAFVGAAGHAYHARAKMPAPLPGKLADAAGRGVEQHVLAGLDRVAAVEQVFHGHALQHRCGGKFVTDALGRFQQPVSGDIANVGIRARSATGIAHALAWRETSHAGTGLDHHTGRFVAEAGGQRHRIKARALVNLLEIDAYCSLAHLHLICPRVGQVYGFEFECFRAAGGGEADDACFGAHRLLLLGLVLLMSDWMGTASPALPPAKLLSRARWPGWQLLLWCVCANFRCAP